MITPRLLAALYGLYGALAVLLLAVLMPPYQNVDEPAHLTRADQVSHSGWVAQAGPGAPALIDAGVLNGALRFSALTRDARSHVTRDLYAPVGWSARQVAAYPSSAVYSPTFYLPAAVALAMGRHNHLSVLPAAELARGLSGAAAVGVGVLAIALAGPASVWLFAVLTLPMALAQAAAVGQDGLMIACSGLAASCLIRLQSAAARHRRALFAVLCLALALVVQARPPYVALALLPLAAGGRRWLRVAGCVAIVAAVAGWSVIALRASGADIGHFNGSDAHAQALLLLTAPWRLLGVLAMTLERSGKGFLEQAVGVLGWLDVHLPRTYADGCMPWLAVAAAATLLAGRGWAGWRRRGDAWAAF